MIEVSGGYRLRPVEPEDQRFLWEMLYQAIFTPPGAPAPPRSVVLQPELARYVEGWGRAADLGFVAEEAERDEPVGAAWLRLLSGETRGYGYVNDETPELSIAVLPDHRGRGLGRRLLIRLMEAARGRFPAVSLSVSRENPALDLYRRLGFQIMSEDASSCVMKLEL